MLSWTTIMKQGACEIIQIIREHSQSISYECPYRKKHIQGKNDGVL